MTVQFTDGGTDRTIPDEAVLLAVDSVTGKAVRSISTNGIVHTLIAEQRASSLMVTGTAAVNTGLTGTLPAPGAGLFQYITSVQIVKLYAATGTASAAGVIITSTNLPGAPAWTTEQAAQGVGNAVTVVNLVPRTPIKAAVANTAVTFVAPAQLETIWRMNVSYFTGA